MQEGWPQGPVMRISALLESCDTVEQIQGRACDLVAERGAADPDEGCPCTR